MRIAKPIYFLLVLALASCSSDSRHTEISVPLTAESVERGRELVHGLASCGFCHGQKASPGSALIGGRRHFDLYGEVRAANLTPSGSGLGKWSARDIIQSLRVARDRDGNELSPEIHQGMEWMADRDMLSIVSFLRAIPAVENKVERRGVSFMDRNTTGFFSGTRQVSGYIPAIDVKHEIQYGRYLVDAVARCGSCHSTPASLISSEKYLAGGKVIKTEAGEKTAPCITNSRVHCIGSWSTEQIVQYLKTGTTPDRNHSDPAFCPTGFYRNASDRDLMAMARYLGTDTESAQGN